MINTATVRSRGHIDDATAARITNLWNLAYPGMRETLTTVINALRDHLARAEQDRPLSEEAKDDTRRRIKRMEETRRDLGQLDRGTHRACTRSAGGFSAHEALSLVRQTLDAVPIGSPRAGGIYRLAAELADVAATDAQRRKAES